MLPLLAKAASSDPKRSDKGKTKAARGLTKRELRGLLAYRAGHSRVQVVKQLRYKYLKGCLASPRIQIFGNLDLCTVVLFHTNYLVYHDTSY